MYALMVSKIVLKLFIVRFYYKRFFASLQLVTNSEKNCLMTPSSEFPSVTGRCSPMSSLRWLQWQPTGGFRFIILQVHRRPSVCVLYCRPNVRLSCCTQSKRTPVAHTPLSTLPPQHPSKPSTPLAYTDTYNPTVVKYQADTGKKCTCLVLNFRWMIRSLKQPGKDQKNSLHCLFLLDSKPDFCACM